MVRACGRRARQDNSYGPASTKSSVLEALVQTAPRNGGLISSNAAGNLTGKPAATFPLVPTATELYNDAALKPTVGTSPNETRPAPFDVWPRPNGQTFERCGGHICPFQTSSDGRLCRKNARKALSVADLTLNAPRMIAFVALIIIGTVAG